MSTETVLALTPTGQSWLSFLITLAIVGLIAGAIARLIVPGPQPMGIFATILVGIAGAFLGGIVGRLLFGPTYTPGLIMSILGAAVIVFALSRSGRYGGGGRRRSLFVARERGYSVDRDDDYVGRRSTGAFGRRDGGFLGGRRSTGMFGRRSGGLFSRRGHYGY
jgi:uncharacterized membrane protein YeaQ/YmgE (transglycosylase-associated protein family)